MKEEGGVLVSNIQTQDAVFKLRLYFKKIKQISGSITQVEKVCHFAAETCLKYFEKDQFVKQVYEIIDKQIQTSKSYFLLYLMDILLKSNKYFMRIAKKNIEQNFKLVWENVWFETKNATKIQYLKAMLKTWGVIYSQRLENDIKKWIAGKYHYKNFALQKKYQDLFAEIFNKIKAPKMLPFELIQMPLPPPNNIQAQAPKVQVSSQVWEAFIG